MGDEIIKQIKQKNLGAVNGLTEQLDEVDQAVTNQNVVVQFMRDILYYNDAKETTCMDTVQAQAEQLEILAVERKEYEKKNKMNLKNAYMQVDIIKSQEREKDLLKQTLETQKSVYEDYGNLTNFDIINNINDFPMYAQLLTKTLSDQAEKIKQMRQYFVEEKKVEENMGEILMEIQNLNFSIATQTTKWDLLSQYQSMVSLQDANLKDLGPALTYVVQNHKRYNYNLNEDGVLLGMELCQCLPETGDSGIQITDIEFICPNGTVFATSLEAELSVVCSNGNCPDVVDLDQCGDFDALPWSDWEKCKGDLCLANSTRQRKIRLNGSISYEYETKGSQPLIMNKTNIFDIYLPEGAKLAVFVMGGGGGADDGESGSSGFFNTKKSLSQMGRFTQLMSQLAKVET